MNQLMMKSLLSIALVALTVGAFMLPAQKQSSNVATPSSEPGPNDESGVTFSSGWSGTVTDAIDHATEAISKPNAADGQSTTYVRPAVGVSSTRVENCHDAFKRDGHTSN
jgi:hypothetical protein